MQGDVILAFAILALVLVVAGLILSVATSVIRRKIYHTKVKAKDCEVCINNGSSLCSTCKRYGIRRKIFFYPKGM